MKAGIRSAPLASGRQLWAESGTSFAIVGWTLPSGDYSVVLTFDVPKQVRAIREKAVYAASISCRRARYLQPVLPVVTSMAHVQALSVSLVAGRTNATVPRVAQSPTTIALPCG